MDTPIVSLNQTIHESVMDDSIYPALHLQKVNPFFNMLEGVIKRISNGM